MRRIPPFPCRRAPGIQTRTDKGSFVCMYTSSQYQPTPGTGCVHGVGTLPAATSPPPPSLPHLAARPPPGWPLWAPRSPLPAPEHGAPAAAGLQEESRVCSRRPGLVTLDARGRNIKALPRPSHVPKRLWRLMLAGGETPRTHIEDPSVGARAPLRSLRALGSSPLVFLHRPPSQAT